MKNTKTRLSANELNRFMYCPYQWYYKRTYGAKQLNEAYKALNIKSSDHESNFVKGLNHHKHYHQQYRLKRLLQVVLGIIILSLLVRMGMIWIQ